MFPSPPPPARFPSSVLSVSPALLSPTVVLRRRFQDSPFFLTPTSRAALFRGLVARPALNNLDTNSNFPSPFPPDYLSLLPDRELIRSHSLSSSGPFPVLIWTLFSLFELSPQCDANNGPLSFFAFSCPARDPPFAKTPLFPISFKLNVPVSSQPSSAPFFYCDPTNTHANLPFENLDLFHPLAFLSSTSPPRLHLVFSPGMNSHSGNYPPPVRSRPALVRFFQTALPSYRRSLNVKTARQLI